MCAWMEHFDESMMKIKREEIKFQEKKEKKKRVRELINNIQKEINELRKLDYDRNDLKIILLEDEVKDIIEVFRRNGRWARSMILGVDVEIK